MAYALLIALYREYGVISDTAGEIESCCHTPRSCDMTGRGMGEEVGGGGQKCGPSCKFYFYIPFLE